MDIAGDVSVCLSFCAQLCLCYIFWNFGAKGPKQQVEIPPQDSDLNSTKDVVPQNRSNSTEYATIEVEDVDDEEAEVMAVIWN